MLFRHVDTAWVVPDDEAQSAPLPVFSRVDWARFEPLVAFDAALHGESIREAVGSLGVVRTAADDVARYTVEKATAVVEDLPATARSRGMLALAVARTARVIGDGGDERYQWAISQATSLAERIATTRELARWQFDRGEVDASYRTLMGAVDVTSEAREDPQACVELVRAELDCAALCEQWGASQRFQMHARTAFLHSDQLSDAGTAHAAAVVQAAAIREVAPSDGSEHEGIEAALIRAQSHRIGALGAVAPNMLALEAHLTALVEWPEQVADLLTACVEDLRVAGVGGVGGQVLEELGPAFLVEHGAFEALIGSSKSRMAHLQVQWAENTSEVRRVEIGAAMLDLMNAVEDALDPTSDLAAGFQEWARGHRLELSRRAAGVVERAGATILGQFRVDIAGLGDETTAVARMVEELQGAPLASTWWELAGRVQAHRASLTRGAGPTRSSKFEAARTAFERAADGFDLARRPADARTARSAAHDVTVGRVPDFGR